LTEKLEEFATYNDKTKNKLRFQNFMKNYLKPHALAVQEWLDGKFTTEIQKNSSMSV
jgi:hypothetical protein